MPPWCHHPKPKPSPTSRPVPSASSFSLCSPPLSPGTIFISLSLWSRVEEQSTQVEPPQGASPPPEPSRARACRSTRCRHPPFP
nr:predicted protein [Hordeum vulgare subsp. vulgare]